MKTEGSSAGGTFWVAFAMLALFLQPGTYINDEVSQVAGLHFLAKGSILVTSDLPEGYDPFLRGLYRHWGVPDPGEPPAPAFASPLLNLLALPVLAGIHLLAAASSVRVALAVVPGLIMMAGARSAFAMVGRPAPAWLGLAVTGTFIPNLWSNDLPAVPYLELAAIHLVSMSGIAWAAALIVNMLERRVGRCTALATGALFLLASPAMFWGLNAKYHGLAIALVAVALWCYQEGAYSSPGRTLLTYAVAGLAMFNYLPIGGLLVLTLGVMSSPAIRLGIKGFSQRMGAALAGLVVGLLPEGTYRWAVGQAGTKQFIVGVGPVEASGTFLPVQMLEASGELLRYNVFTDFFQAAPVIGRAFLMTRWMDDGAVLPLLVVAPWAVLSAVTLLRKPLRQRLGGPVWGFALAHIAIVVAVMGRALLGTSAGIDVRYASTMWPAFAVLAAPALGLAMREEVWKPSLWAAGILVFILSWLGIMLNLVLHGFGMTLTPQGNVFDQVFVARWTGLAIAVGLALAWAWKRLGPLRTPLVAAAVLAALALQILLQLAFANRFGNAPFSAWPIELLARFIHGMLF